MMPPMGAAGSEMPDGMPDGMPGAGGMAPEFPNEEAPGARTEAMPGAPVEASEAMSGATLQPEGMPQAETPARASVESQLVTRELVSSQTAAGSPNTGRRVCLFGGSFDPVHGGHLAMARAVLEAGEADTVVFLPARLSPFKMQRPPLFAAGMRLWLLRRALRGERGMELSTLDLELPPPSWTWRLVECWRRLHPQDELCWLMGTDQWNELHRWARFDLLAEQLRFIVYHRGEGEPMERPGLRVRFIVARHPASSSAIREALLRGEAVPEGQMRGDLAEAVERLFCSCGRFRLDKALPSALESACMNPPAIAIDGPAASGKSTVARLLAERLGFTFINTGAMYRAVTWCLLQRGIDPADTEAVVRALPELPLSFGKKEAVSCVLCEGRELGDELTAPETNAQVSSVASIPQVRAYLVDRQREYNCREAVVMEGRDIGTVVFPETPFKYFVTASEEVRAARRAAQGLTDSIAERDRKDSQRACAPLTQAPDAKLVDTSEMSIAQVVDLIADDVISRMAKA